VHDARLEEELVDRDEEAARIGRAIDELPGRLGVRCNGLLDDDVGSRREDRGDDLCVRLHGCADVDDLGSNRFEELVDRRKRLCRGIERARAVSFEICDRDNAATGSEGGSPVPSRHQSRSDDRGGEPSSFATWSAHTPNHRERAGQREWTTTLNFSLDRERDRT
jgi:hypothetical protein